MESGWKTPKEPTAGMDLGEPPDPCFRKYAAGEICSVDGKESIGVIHFYFHGSVFILKLIELEIEIETEIEKK